MKSLITAFCSSHFLALFIIFLLLPSPATSQTPSPANPYNGQISPQIGIVVLVITVFIFLMAFFSIYVRHCSEFSSSATATRGSGVIPGRYMQNRRGLDPAIIETFPVFNYSAVKEMKLGKGALECAVCLNEFEDDETLRLIPNCDHVYHAECIDVWLESHATCPVCRANLVPVPGESINSPVILHIQNDDVPSESMEQPLNATRRARRLIRSSTRTNTSGRRRWFGLFLRSHSTGHVAVTQLDNTERFTLRLPEEFRRQIITGKLNRTTSCFVEGSPRVMNRTMLGGSYKESINRTRFDQADRWTFSLTPPFFSAASASVQPNKAADGLHKPSLPLPPV